MDEKYTIIDNYYEESKRRQYPNKSMWIVNIKVQRCNNEIRVDCELLLLNNEFIFSMGLALLCLGIGLN